MTDSKNPTATPEETDPEVEVVDDDDREEEPVRDPEELIAELTGKLDDEHNRLLRTAAELENLRKRTRRDVEDALVRGRSEVLGALLPTIDALDLAIKSSDPEGSANAVLEGIEMVRRQFISSLDGYGLKAIETDDQAFDPTFHEAVAQAPFPGVPAGVIGEEMRKGYMLKDRLLRASMVIVSTGDPPEPAPEPTESTPTDEEGETADA